MILCDSGPLVAFIDRADSHHSTCIEILKNLFDGPLVTTWPCLTEAMYLVGKHGRFDAQEELWTHVVDGSVTLHISSLDELVRMHALMRQYRDAPMDLADASLVVAAETFNLTKIFTLDSHFHAYRIHDTKPFEVVPS